MYRHCRPLPYTSSADARPTYVHARGRTCTRWFMAVTLAVQIYHVQTLGAAVSTRASKDGHASQRAGATTQRYNMLLRFRFVLAGLAAAAAADPWSFKTFLEGDWDLERHTAGNVEYAHYSLKPAAGSLEGSYHEDGEDGPTNHKVVRVIFDSAVSGEFQLAKAAAGTPTPTQFDSATDEPPTPQPQPEPKTAFEFDFRAQNDGRFYLSESKCVSTPPLEEVLPTALRAAYTPRA